MHNRYIFRLIANSLIAAAVMVLTQSFIYQTPTVKAIGYLTVKVTNPNCISPGAIWNYSDIDTAVKDTVPLEWWPPSSLGGTLTHSGLQTAATIVRSRIKWNQEHPLNTQYHYTCANRDSRTANPPPLSIYCNDYTMNTVNNARQYSSGTYNSNAATDQTWNNYIVDLYGFANMVGFHGGTGNVQWQSTICGEQSDDWKFCAISSLGVELSYANNRYSRRLNTQPTDKIRFEAEAFTSRIATSHSWLCQNDSSHWGYKNKCYMRASPNNGGGYDLSNGYTTASPRMNYWVAFPQTGGTTWYIWARGKGCGPNNDSIHVGLNENRVPTAEDMTGWDSCTAGTNGFVWSRLRMNGSNAYLVADTDLTNQAFKRLTLWMREDGMRVDRIILTQTAGYNPNNDSWANGY